MAQFFAVWTSRLDYPLVDDWRYYSGRSRMPAELSLTWLFASAHDTLHLTGKFLDWLTFRWFGHDYRLLAVTSFFVWFGGWAIASVTLALRFTRDQAVVRFAALLAFVLPFAAAPYWVTVSPLQQLEPGIAYHQMLPVLGVCLLSWLAVVEGRNLARCVLATLVTLIFSLAYSSGAVGLFLFGSSVAILAAIGRLPGASGRLVELGAVVSLTAAACLILHVTLTIDAFGINPLVETRAKRLAVSPPWQRDFWLFFLGLLDRAVFSLSTGIAGGLRGMAVAAAILVPGGLLGARLVRRRGSVSDPAIDVVLVGLFAFALGYAVLVSYGRASFGNFYFIPFEVPTGPEARASLYAHSRFFYWWITASLPFVVIAWGRVFAARSRGWARVAALVLGVLLLGTGLANWESWQYRARYRADAERVLQLIDDHRRRWPASPEHYQWARRLEATFLDQWAFEPRPPAVRD